MRLFLKFSLGLMVLTVATFALRTDETYSPSIAALKPNETLVMKYSACHSGCDKGIVEFKNQKARMNGYTLDLSAEEIRQFDSHFLLGDDLADDYFCSLEIMISFQKRKPFNAPVKKKPRRYQCVFNYDETRVSPEALVYHFNATPRETPFWRRPAEDRILKIKN